MKRWLAAALTLLLLVLFVSAVPDSVVIGPYSGPIHFEGDAYRMGINKRGLPVFQDGGGALRAVKVDYAGALAAARAAGLDLEDRETWYLARVCLEQCPAEGELMEELRGLADFFDVYENALPPL